MSTLLLDIGNSRLKWVLVADLAAPLAPAQAIPHQGAPAEALRQLPGLDADAVCIAHVTGAAHEAALSAAAQQRWQVVPRFARSSATLAGLHSGYAEPTRLGVDRWLAMLALWAQQHSAFCVASAGTALTFDAVDAEGQHQGGVIAPGLSTMVAATLGHTRFAVDQDAAAAGGGFAAALGRDTESAVRQGALHAAAGALERLGREHPGSKHLSGGDAGRLLPHLTGGWQAAPDLVLQGLAAWAALETGQ